MCGIFGFIKNRENLNNQEIEYSRKKTKELNYRGPDSYGEWKKDNKYELKIWDYPRKKMSLYGEDWSFRSGGPLTIF